MRRIGIIAEHIAKGNLFLYHFYVLLYSSLISLIVFLLSAFTIIIGVSVVVLVMRQPVVLTPESLFAKLLFISLMVLAGVVGILNLWVVVYNIRLRNKKKCL